MTIVDKQSQTYIASEPAKETERKVWDLPVRLFHWTLAAAFIGAYATNKLGVSYFKYHLWCGYIVIILVFFRIVWGFAGTRYARFVNFVRGPIKTLHYARNIVRHKPRFYAGHNPLGAWMVLILLAGLGVQAVIGLFGNDEIYNFGPLYGYAGKDLSLTLTSLHRHLFYWIFGAVALHVAAVAAHGIFGRENLVKAMFTGKKSSPDFSPKDTPISSSRLWLAGLIVAALSLSLAAIVTHAPAPADDSSDF